MSAPKHDIQRIRVDAQGFDSDGAYWGAGPDVFIARIVPPRHAATSKEDSDQITVRARNMTEARKRIADELVRKPGEEAAERPPLGGNTPRKTRYQIQWHDPASTATITIRITHARDYLSSGSDHIEVESVAPKKAPMPITETGYRSHFIPALDLINAGGPVTVVTNWLAQEAKGKAWSKAATQKAQGDLFQWAEAGGEVATRKQSPKPKRADVPRRTKRGKPVEPD